MIPFAAALLAASTFAQAPGQGTLGTTTNLLITVVDSETGDPVPGAQVLFVETGDARISDADGLAAFETDWTASNDYWDQETPFTLQITAQGYSPLTRTLKGWKGCQCEGKSWRFFAVGLAALPGNVPSAPSGGGSAAGPSGVNVLPVRPDDPQTDGNVQWSRFCFWQLSDQPEPIQGLPCPTQGVSLGQNTYVNGNSPGTVSFKQKVTTSFTIKNGVALDLGLKLGEFGFGVEFSGSQAATVTNSAMAKGTLGNTFPGCNGSVNLRFQRSEITFERWCFTVKKNLDGTFTKKYRKTGEKKKEQVITGVCIDAHNCR
ncbi:MAG: hypothetical protein ACE5H3_00880 [Planctomycetota bacterium]